MWEREERFELVFCVPQTSLPASSAPVPCEPPVWNHACLGLRGGSAYVRPSVSPAATGSPAAVGVERGSGSVCCTTLRRSLPTLKRQRNVLLFLTQLPTPTAAGGAWWVTTHRCGLWSRSPTASSPVRLLCLLHLFRALASQGPGSNTRLRSLTSSQSELCKPAIHTHRHWV